MWIFDCLNVYSLTVIQNLTFCFIEEEFPFLLLLWIIDNVKQNNRICFGSSCAIFFLLFILQFSFFGKGSFAYLFPGFLAFCEKKNRKSHMIYLVIFKQLDSNELQYIYCGGTTSAIAMIWISGHGELHTEELWNVECLQWFLIELLLFRLNTKSRG